MIYSTMLLKHNLALNESKWVKHIIELFQLAKPNNRMEYAEVNRYGLIN